MKIRASYRRYRFKFTANNGYARLLGGRTFRVNHDPVAVGTLAAKRLSVLGCAGYAFVGYTREWAWSRARLDAFRAALGPAGEGVRHFEFPAARQPTASRGPAG